MRLYSLPSFVRYRVRVLAPFETAMLTRARACTRTLARRSQKNLSVDVRVHTPKEKSFSRVCTRESIVRSAV